MTNPDGRDPQRRPFHSSLEMGRIRLREPPSFFVLRTEETLALKGAKHRRRACTLRPPRGASLARLVLLAGGLEFFSGLLQHRRGTGEDVRRAPVAVKLGGDEQLGIWRKKMEMWQDFFTELDRKSVV